MQRLRNTCKIQKYPLVVNCREKIKSAKKHNILTCFFTHNGANHKTKLAQMHNLIKPTFLLLKKVKYPNEINVLKI